MSARKLNFITPRRAVLATIAMIAALVATLIFAGSHAAATPPCCAPVPAGIVSWWQANDSPADIISHFDGSLQGGVSYVPGEVAHGWSFQSVNDYVSVPDEASLYPGTGPMTVDAWVESAGPEGAGGEQIVRHYECAGFCTNAASSSNWDMRIVGGKAWFFLRDENSAGPDSGGQILQGTTNIEDGHFHHVAFVRDTAANKLRLYVDGNLQVEATQDPNVAGPLANIDGDADPVTIGGGILGGTSNPDPNVEYTGVIDEVDYFNSAVSGSDIQAIFAAGPNGKCTDSIAPTSMAGAPASSVGTSPITVSWNASDSGGSGLARIGLEVQAPGQAGFTEVASQQTSASSGSFSYTPTAGPGNYAFYTLAEDANCGREAAPAMPDAVTSVSAAPTPTHPATAVTPVTPPKVVAATPPKVAAPTPVTITQIATLPSSHACLSKRRLTIHLLHVKGLLRAVISLNGKAARTVTGSRLGLPIDLRGLPKGTFDVQIVITTKQGKRLVGHRRYHTCVAGHRH